MLACVSRSLPGSYSPTLLVAQMPQELLAPIAEAKETRVSENEEPLGAPLRLMTQFLRAVSENRMEQALALAQTGT